MIMASFSLPGYVPYSVLAITISAHGVRLIHDSLRQFTEDE